MAVPSRVPRDRHDRPLSPQGSDPQRHPRPDQIFSRWVSAGIFVLEPSALDGVPAGAAVDFGRHVFPNLLAQGARLHGYRMGRSEKLVWIDRPEDLRRAEARWKRLAASFEAS